MMNMLIVVMSVFCPIGIYCSGNIKKLANLTADSAALRIYHKNQTREFLNLHVTYCGHISLCTLPAKMDKTDLNLNYGDTPCCHQCSCSTDCEMMSNCCPDYELFQIQGAVTFSNVSGLVQAMEESGLFDRTDDPRGHDDIDNKSNCVKNGLLDSSRVPKGPDYKMVTSCPVQNSSGIDFARKCELPDGDLESNIPVYSHTDNRTYRNIMCLACHGLTLSSATYWNVVMVCGEDEIHLNQHFMSPGDVTRALKSGYLRQCNIIYVPEQNMKTTKCSAVDITSCPHHKTFNHVIEYDFACRKHLLPVTHTNGGHTHIYKNIACFHCNNPDVAFKEYCKNRTDYKLLLQLSNRAKLSLKTTDFTSLDIEIDKSGHCGKGKVFDNVTSECRLVLCPRLMYNHNGSCFPLYKSLGPVFYSLLLKATYTKETKQLQTSLNIADRATFAQEALDALISALRKTLSNDSGSYEFDFAVLAKAKDLPGTTIDGAEYYVVYVKFWYPHFLGDYFLVVKQAREMLSSLARLNTKSSIGAIAFNLRLYASVKQPISEIVDNTQSSSALTSKYIHTGRKLSMLEVPLTINSFCYRLSLKFGEFRFFRGHYVILRTGENVYPLNFDPFSKTNAPLTCVQNLLPEYYQDMFMSKSEVEKVEIVAENADESEALMSRQTSIQIAAFSSFLAMVFIAVLVAVLRKYCIYRS